MLRATSVVTFVFAGALGLTGACGGKSAEEPKRGATTAGNGGDDGSAAHGGEPDPGSGGSMASAGSPGRAGSPGNGGTTRPPTGPCWGPSAVDPRGCAAAFLNWTHDEETGVCLPIIYGGCGATENNYASLAECQQACSGGKLSYDACEQASDCMVQPANCCGCSGQTFTAHDLIAFNRAHLNELDTCSNRDFDCTPCPDEPNGAQRYFVPVCVAGQCAVEDLRESKLTACELDTDCKLRLGSECCTACGEGTNLIAVPNDGSFEQYVCGDEPPGCPECEGTIPDFAEARCESGHCQVVYAMP